MKNMYILSSIAILAVVGILVCCVSYTRGTAAIDTSGQTSTVTSKQALKKKSCPCCDEKQKRTRQMMRHWLNEKSQENSSNKKVSATAADPEQTQSVR